MVAAARASVSLPWGAWYGDGEHALELPPGWEVDVLAPADLSPASPEEITAALRAPIDAPSFADLARRGRTACIVVDDLARPTRAADVLPELLGQLEEGGIERANVVVLVATGTHGPLDERAARAKVGDEAFETTRVESHDAGGDLRSSGVRLGELELRLAPAFLAADVKIAIGSVLPHSFAAYSGGAKAMLPGLADRDATARSHKFVQMGLRGGADPDRNRFRTETEEIARRLGLHTGVAIVPTARRRTGAVFAGDIVSAHRAACRRAAEAYATAAKGPYDAAILNAYPKDTDLIQAENVFVALKGNRRPLVRDGGLLVIATAASEGLGQHGLFAPGGLSYRPPRPRRGLGERDLWIYAPSLEPEAVRRLHWEGYASPRGPAELASALSEKFPSGGRMAVLPCAPQQRIVDDGP